MRGKSGKRGAVSEAYDVIVIGGGVVGAATAFELKRLGCDRVLLIERDQTCSGGTAKSCAIVRTHYSIPTNTMLAQRSLGVFENFRESLGDDAADCGWAHTGYLILAPEGAAAKNLEANLAMQAGVGAETRAVGADEARELHPLLALDDVAAIGYEPRSGFADPSQTTYSYVRAGLALGVELLRHRAVTGLTHDGGRVTGVETYAADIPAGAVVAAMGPWSPNLARWLDIDMPIALSRHTVATFGAAEPYERHFPIVKDLTTDTKLYVRPAGGRGALVGTGDHGVPIESPAEVEGPVDMAFIADIGAQLSRRMPSFAKGEFTGTWNGPYDITPDWNPILGPVDGFDGLHLACGFSGHGFKLAPAVGEMLARTVLGLETEIDIAPYRLGRFAEGKLLTGAYGIGSIS